MWSQITSDVVLPSLSSTRLSQLVPAPPAERACAYSTRAGAVRMKMFSYGSRGWLRASRKYGWMHFNLGSAYFSQENWNFASQSFEKAAEQTPTEPAAAYNVAICDQRLGHFGDADGGTCCQLRGPLPPLPTRRRRGDARSATSGWDGCPKGTAAARDQNGGSDRPIPAGALHRRVQSSLPHAGSSAFVPKTAMARS